MLQNISDFKAALVLGDEFVFCACLDWVFLVCSTFRSVLNLQPGSQCGFFSAARRKAHPWADQPSACGLDMVQTPAPGEVHLSQTTTRTRRAGNREVNTLHLRQHKINQCY